MNTPQLHHLSCTAPVPHRMAYWQWGDAQAAHAAGEGAADVVGGISDDGGVVRGERAAAALVECGEGERGEVVSAGGIVG